MSDQINLCWDNKARHQHQEWADELAGWINVFNITSDLDLLNKAIVNIERICSYENSLWRFKITGKEIDVYLA